jgi:hypothetical protein
MLFQVGPSGNGNESPRHGVENAGFVTTEMNEGDGPFSAQ